MTVGWLLPPALAALAGSDAPADPTEVYVRRLAQDYGLDREQERLLRIVVQKRVADELAVLRGAQFELLPPALQTQIRTVRRWEEERIRRLLKPEQLARFDREVAGGAGR